MPIRAPDRGDGVGVGAVVGLGGADGLGSADGDGGVRWTTVYGIATAAVDAVGDRS